MEPELSGALVRPAQRKRCREEGISVPYAAYGMVTGQLSNIPDLAPSCGIVLSGWPSWAIAANARGWNARVIIHKQSLWAHQLASWFPDAMIFDISDVPNHLVESLNLRHWFCDVDPPHKLGLWNSNAESITCLRRACHIPTSDWIMTRHYLSHSEAGDLTDGKWSLHHYTRNDVYHLLPITLNPPRDLRCALDTTTEGRPCPPPRSLTSTSPTVTLLRPNTYHGNGILHWSERDCFVVTPCIFSPTEWVRRRISDVEWFSILDIQASFHQELSPAERRSIILDTSFIPEKVVFKLLDAFPCPTVEDTPAPKRPFLKLDDSTSLESLTFPGSVVPVIHSSDRAMRNTKATKNDDAEVPVYLWDEGIVADGDPSKLAALGRLRVFALCWWRRHTTKDFLRWMREHYPTSTRHTMEYSKDRAAGLDCICRCANSSWWEWSAGSRPMFWRWPAEYKITIRDGVKPWIKGPLPEYKLPQRGEKDPAIRDAIKKKLGTVIDKGYLVRGEVRSLTSFFTVPKGEGDVRIVYDGTKSGFNGQLWAPWFPLPTIETHLRSVQADYFMGDIDFSEKFLNFILHEKLRKYAGVDVTPFFPEELNNFLHVLWMHWERCGMGFVFSPYNSIQGTLFAEEFIRGDHLDPNNVFRWDFVLLNLPGSEFYNPAEPWVCKVRRHGPAGRLMIANDLVIYVDDVRTIASSYDECRLASRRVASPANYLGLQDAARKRRDPSRTPGPWAGSIVSTNQDLIEVSVSQDRWDKAKNMIYWIRDSLQESDTIEHKTLESYRGFLIYISRTYPSITPYLKGIHLTLDSWRPWRSEDAWKLSMSEIKAALIAKNMSGPIISTGGKPPIKVKIAPRLHDDIRALLLLFSSVSPPQRAVRPTKSCEALYMFGDASGSGFGSSLMIDNTIHYRHGQWSTPVSKESSNYRELSNLVHAIREASSRGLLKDSELFVFTDNMTAESAFYKGTSSSKKLFDLVLELRQLQMHERLLLHLIHVSGHRMIAQETDGLSRGLTSQGAMSGSSFLEFVSLHRNAVERQGQSLLDWTLSWFNGEERPLLLQPDDWFTMGHTHPTCIWIPPPAAADVALEQMALSIHKRPGHLHLILIPRLLTSRWRKFLGKVCTLNFTIPLGSDIWRDSHFEPLIAGLYLPLSRHKPWNLRGTPMLERVERLLREMPPSNPRWGRIVLRELLFQAKSLETMPASLVRPMLHPSG